MSRSSFRSLGAIVLALVLSGCWLQGGYGPGNTRFNDVERGLTKANVASLSEQWRVPIDATVTEPLVSDGRVYTTTRKYLDFGPTLEVLGVQAYDRTTGELEWEQSLIPVEGPGVTGNVATPALEDGALWVPYWHDGLGPCRGELARLDPDTGEIISNDLIGPHASDLVVAGSTVAYMTGTCAGGPVVVVRDEETRAVLWSHQFPDGAGVATPTIADGRLFVLLRDTLYAFDADGCGTDACDPLWTEPVDPGIFGFLRLAAGPGGSLVTVAESSDPNAGGTVVVRDAATGDIRWEAEPHYTGPVPGAITGVAVAYNTVYVAGAKTVRFGTEAILDAYPLHGCGQPVCTPTWTVDLGPTRPSSEPTVAGDVVYVPLAAGTGTTDAPAVAAVNARGCGSPICEEISRAPLARAFLFGTQPYVTSVADRGVFVGLIPAPGVVPQTELIAFGPSRS